MKKIIFGFALLVFVVKAQDNTYTVKSQIKEVTVYTSQASLKHVTQGVNIPQGRQTIIIEDVSTDIIPSTIQLNGTGNFVILTSQFKINYIQTKQVSKQIKVLEDSLDFLQNKKDLLDIQMASYNNEEQLLLSNKNIGGNNTGVSVTELEKMANFYRNRLNDIRSKKLDLKPKTKKYQELITNIQNQLSELNAKKNMPVGEIVVDVYANSAVNNAQFTVEYICNNAYWSPEYEIRVNDLDKPASLSLKAQIVQNTGVDWKNVQLKLSTATPMLNNNKPELNPWWLVFQQPVFYYKTKTKKNVPTDQAPASIASGEIQEQDKKLEAPMKDAQSIADFISLAEKITTQEYQITIPADIASNNKPYRVDIQTYSVNATYLYYVAPKVTEDAYLMAEITDWEKYNLMPAPLYIFIENAFIGNSEINPDVTKDTIQISLGQDKGISVKRQLVKKINEKKIIGSQRKETKGYEIIVRNKKKNNIQIIIEDQIPLSSMQEVEVELLEQNGASYDKVTGKLSWKLEIKPGEEKKVMFKYSVKYPKDKIISNL